MKNEEEIQRAHDILDMIVCGELQTNLPDWALHEVANYKYMLCWILGHADGKQVEAKLASLEAGMFAAGILLYKEGEKPEVPISVQQINKP